MARRKPIVALVIEAGAEPRTAIIKDPASCREFLEIIGCDSLDFVTRAVGGKRFCLAVDDEGLLKEGLPCSGVCGLRERIVGRIVVTGREDGRGILTGLSEMDLSVIRGSVVGGVLCYGI